MEGVGALVNGLGGASPVPEDDTAADLAENSSEFGNGSAQLSVDDLASGSHDPAMQGTSPAAATAPVSSASLPAGTGLPDGDATGDDDQARHGRVIRGQAERGATGGRGVCRSQRRPIGCNILNLTWPKAVSTEKCNGGTVVA